MQVANNLAKDKSDLALGINTQQTNAAIESLERASRSALNSLSVVDRTTIMIDMVECRMDCSAMNEAIASLSTSDPHTEIPELQYNIKMMTQRYQVNCLPTNKVLENGGELTARQLRTRILAEDLYKQNMALHNQHRQNVEYGLRLRSLIRVSRP